VYFHLGRVEERRRLAVARDLQHLSFVARARPERAVGAGHERPDERRGGLGDLRRGRAEKDASVAVDRQVLDISLEEVGLRGDRPERRDGRREQGGRGKHHGRRDTDSFQHARMAIGPDGRRDRSSARACR
jgi:hypothetical protein